MWSWSIVGVANLLPLFIVITTIIVRALDTAHLSVIKGVTVPLRARLSRIEPGDPDLHVHVSIYMLVYFILSAPIKLITSAHFKA